MSSPQPRCPFALEIQDLSWRLRRIGFIAALLLCSIGQAIFIDGVKMTAESGQGVSTSIGGALKQGDMSIPMAGTQPIYPFEDPFKAHQLAFFQAATGIKDISQLKSHIIHILQQAYKLSPYPCIWSQFWNFNSTFGKVINHHLYPKILEVAQQQSNQQHIFVEIGAFLGPNLRRVVHDGWKRENVFAIDIVQAWPRLGSKLFNDANNPTTLFEGDIWMPEVFDSSRKDSNFITSDFPPINLGDLKKDLNPLRRRARFIMVNSLFHILREEDQYKLAKKCEALLSEEKGSAIFGMQRGEQVNGIQNLPGKKEAQVFCHSPESWNKLWNSIFKPGEVKLVTYLENKGLHANQSIQGAGSTLFLMWSVTRT